MSTKIYTITGLQAMSSGLATDYELANDIDATITSSWNSGAGFAPIGSSSTPFTGTFDGKGYTIRGLYINRASTQCIGLFGYTDGASGNLVEIKNVKLTEVNITGSMYVGGLVGYTNGYATISDVCVSGDIASGLGIAGGLVGYRGASNDIIVRCYTSGTVTSTVNQAGGLVGGDYDDSGSISDSYSTSTVSGTLRVGGLIGEFSGNADNCYSVGSVSGSTNVGGLIGWVTGTYSCTNSFWDTQTSGQATSAAGTGKTTAQMKTKTTFTDAGWDFTTPVWDIVSTINSGYPYLGASTSFWSTRSYTTPVIYDKKGRIPKGARIQARRNDTGEVVEEETLNSSGQATFTQLPAGVGVTFYGTWGGSATAEHEELLFSTITGISEGGTGASDTETAKANLGIQIGVNIQQYHDRLTDISNITPTDSNIIVGDGTNLIAESGATARTSLGLGTGDSPQLTAVNIGHATDTTVARASAGDINVEGNIVYRASGTDVPVTDGGTGASTATGALTNLGAASASDLTTHAADTSTHGASDIADVSDIAVDANLSVAAQAIITNGLVHADVDDTPVNGETTVPVSSNWAFDHNALSVGVHGIPADPGADKVLGWDDSESALAWVAGGGGTIDGSGTTGKITKWVDSDTIGDATNTDAEVADAVTKKHSQNTDKTLVDADGDTKIQVEESADEDKIRMDVKGVESFLLEDTGILTLAKQSAARAYITGTTQQTIPTITLVPIYLGAENYDTQSEFDSSAVTGTTTSAAANKLKDSGASFVAGDLGRRVWNTTDNTYSYVTAVDSSIQLSINDDIMANGEGYKLYHSKFTATKAGLYLITCCITYFSLADQIQGYAVILKNGSQYLSVAQRQSIATAGYLVPLALDIVNLAVNDYIQLAGWHNSATSEEILYGTERTFLAICKIA